MYQMSHFQEEANIIQFLKENPFATIVGHDGNQLAATHIPLLLSNDNDGNYILKGHIMKNTDHHKAFINNNSVLALFQGPNCYVSSSWYEERGHASTWNYISIHVHGTLSFMSEKETHQLLIDLTNQFEQGMEQPMLVQDMDNDYILQNLKAIAGFQIKINNMNGTFKLSQNQSNISQENIINNLNKSEAFGAKEVAKEMRKRLI